MPEKKRPEYPRKPPRVPDTSPERLKAIVERHEYYRHHTHYTECFEALEDTLALLKEVVRPALCWCEEIGDSERERHWERIQDELERFDAGSDGGDTGKAG